MITEDNVLVGVANWALQCGEGYPGESKTNLIESKLISRMFKLIEFSFEY